MSSGDNLGPAVFLPATYASKGIRSSPEFVAWLQKAARNAPISTNNNNSSNVAVDPQKVRSEYFKSVHKTVLDAFNATGGIRPVQWNSLPLPGSSSSSSAAATQQHSSNNVSLASTIAASKTKTTTAAMTAGDTTKERSQLMRQVLMLAPSTQTTTAAKVNEFFQLFVDPKQQGYAKLNAGELSRQFSQWNQNHQQHLQQVQAQQQQQSTSTTSSSLSSSLLPAPSSSSNYNGGNNNNNSALLAAPAAIRRGRNDNNNNSNSNNTTATHHQTLVGTSKALEREFVRTELSADILRPLHVLKLAKNHILKKSKDSPEFKRHPVEGLSWLFRQLKGMRQDIRAQNLDSNSHMNINNVDRNDEDADFSVSVYQLHAAISLHLGDLSEYIQCQAQIKTLHDEKNLSTTPLEVEEFTVYRLLELALAGQDDVVTQEIRHLSVLCEKLQLTISMCDLFVSDQRKRFAKQQQSSSFEEFVLMKSGVTFGSTAKDEYDFLKKQIINTTTTEEENNISSSTEEEVKSDQQQDHSLLTLFIALNDRFAKRIISMMSSSSGNNQTALQNKASAPHQRALAAKLLESDLAQKIFSCKNLNFTTTFKTTTTMNNVREVTLSKKLISANTSLACLMKRAEMKILLESLAFLQRSDGKSFLKSILKLHAKMIQTSASSSSSLLHLVRIFLQRSRTKWLYQFCRSIKGTDTMSLSILKNLLGFESGIDLAIHQSLGVVSKFHSHTVAHHQHQNHHHHSSSSSGQPQIKFVSPEHQNFFQLLEAIKFKEGMPILGTDFASTSSKKEIDFEALTKAIVAYTNDLGTGTLNVPKPVVATTSSSE